MKKVINVLTITSLFALLLGFSCKKDTENSVNDSMVNQVQDNALVDGNLDEAMLEAESGIDSKLYTGLKSALVVDCRTITLEGADYPKKVSIDFGTDGCVGRGLRAKTGKIVATLTDKPWKKGSVKTIVFENFKVNGNKLEGTKTVTYKGLNSSGQPFWEITFDGSITFKKDSAKVIRKFSRVRTMTDGFEIIEWKGDTIAIFSRKKLDYAFEITGSGSGTTRGGKNYTDKITKVLVFNNNCKHIRSGEVEIDLEGVGVFSFGYENDNNCSGKATIKFEGISKEIKLND